jgi:hypothetical protein
VSERIDDLMERMERLMSATEMWRWHFHRQPDGTVKVGVWRELHFITSTPERPTLRAALEDALTQAEKAVADE